MAVPQLPGKRAFFGTLATGVWTQALTLVTGALTARLLGPEGRGQFAGAQVWPGILGMVALLGFNNAFSIRAAKEQARKGAFEKQALKIGILLSLAWSVVGWFAMAWLVPPDNPELLWLSRVSIINVPLFVLTSNLMAIDQGCGDFRMFNAARNILTPVYLLLLLIVFWVDVRDAVWFIAALLAANLAVLAYRLSVVRWHFPGSAPVAPSDLFRTGLPFWITGIAAVFRDNAERLLLMFLLGPVALGLYVVAFTASAAHLNVSRSLNLVAFSRAATLLENHALHDAARFFRLMGVMNSLLGLGMVAAMPALIWLIYGQAFSGSVVPAMLLVTAQFFLSQGGILDEALRARARPMIGLGGMLVGMTVFAGVGCTLARPFGLLGVAMASISGQVAYCVWMIVAFRRAGKGLRLVPSRSDFAELTRIFRDTMLSVTNRLGARSPA